MDPEDILNSYYGKPKDYLNMGQNWGAAVFTDASPAFNNVAAASTQNSVSEPSFMQMLTGYTDTQGNKINGIGGLGLGVAQGIGNIYMGMQDYGMKKKMFKQSQENFNRQFAAQKNLTNSRLEDRQNARLAANPSAYMSTAEYMQKYGVK